LFFFEGRFKSVAILDEESQWLCPIEDRRRVDSTREGMLEGFSLGSSVVTCGWPEARTSPTFPNPVGDTLR